MLQIKDTIIITPIYIVLQITYTSEALMCDNFDYINSVNLL